MLHEVLWEGGAGVPVAGAGALLAAAARAATLAVGRRLVAQILHIPVRDQALHSSKSHGLLRPRDHDTDLSTPQLRQNTEGISSCP